MRHHEATSHSGVDATPGAEAAESVSSAAGISLVESTPPTSTAAGLQAGAPGRHEALSDGVFAIAMTLLVLDLRTPPHRDGRLLPSLREQWPAYASFIASFLFIGVIWANHHATFREIDHRDRGLTWANLGILFGAVLLPFPTTVLAQSFRSGNQADELTAAVLYAIVAALATLAWLVLFLLLHRRSSPLSSTGSLASWYAQSRRPVVGSLAYLIGALLGLVTPALSLATFVLVPIYFAVTSEGIRQPSQDARR